ncbi:MAG: TlpA family protein disulfide reductase [Alistipes sp.]|nr:TlpA family protein disulfide reductase [Alistipes sp.]
MRCALLLSLLIFAAGCGRGGTPDTGHIVVIFDRAPDHSRITFQDGSSTSRIVPVSNSRIATFSYVDENYRVVQYHPAPDGHDTLGIPSPGPYAEVLHRYRVYGEEKYLLMQGDTVLFTYGDMGEPHLRSLTDPANTALYNIPFQVEGYRTHQGFDIRSALSADFNFARRIFDPALAPPRGLREKFGMFDLDFRGLESRYDEYRGALSAALDSLGQAGLLPHQVGEYYRWIYLSDSQEAPAQYSDSLMFLQTYQNLIAGKTIGDIYARAAAAGGGQTRLCGRKLGAIFDSIAGEAIPERVRALSLRMVLDLIKEVNDATLELEYTRAYIALTGDSLEAAALEKERAALESTGDMILRTAGGQQVDFSSLMESYRGSVVYLGFWASWCAPCRAAMPAAYELRRKYEGKNIVFLYLALFDKRESWLQAVDDCKTDQGGENYFIENGKAADFIKSHAVGTIPRYMIFDSAGNLVDANAPGPSHGKALEGILDRYIVN